MSSFRTTDGGFEVATWGGHGADRLESAKPRGARKYDGLGCVVEIDKNGLAYLNRLERISPKILVRARGWAANAAKRALFSTIRRHGNPKYGVPKLAKRQPLTRKLHGGKPSEIFGKFSSDSAYQVAYVRGDVQYIGWPDSLHTFMSALQSAAHRDFTPDEKRRIMATLADRGQKGTHIPASYSRPDRSVIDPFAASLAELYPQWVTENFNKMYNQRVARRAS